MITKAIAGIAPTFDDDNCAVAGWLSAPTIDHSGEFIDGKAFDLARHKSIPLLLWQHDVKTPPIGKWEDEAGNYTVSAQPYPGGGHGLYGTAYFAKDARNPLARTIHSLYAEKILRGFSVGFRAPDPKPAMIGRQKALKYEMAELLECSCVSMPENQHALAKVVYKGVVAGERIPEQVLLRLKSCVPAVKIFPAWSVEKSGIFPCTLAATGAKSKLQTHPTDRTMSQAAEPATPTGFDEAMPILKSLFDPAVADKSADLEKLTLVFKTHKIIADTPPVVNDGSKKVVADMAARLNELSPLADVVKGLSTNVDTLKAMVEAVGTKVDGIDAKYDGETTALQQNIEAVANTAGFLKAA